MTVTLGAITLDDSLVLVGYHNRLRRPVSVHYGLAGGLTIQSAPAAEIGAPLVLEARQEGASIYGRYTGAQVEAINALYEAGADVALVHHLGSWTVRIIDREFEPVIDLADPDGTDWYTGTVSMIVTG